MTLKRLPMAEKDSKNNRWKCSPRVTPSGFICIYFCICLGSFFFCFSNKTVPDFHDSQNSFRVFVENMNKMLLQTCWNTTAEALRVRGRLWTPSRPLSGFDKVLRARWRGSGLSIFGFEEKKQKKRRQARSCFWGSIFYFFLMPHITAHTHTLAYFTPPEIAHTPQRVFAFSLGLPKEKVEIHKLCFHPLLAV